MRDFIADNYTGIAEALKKLRGTDVSDQSIEALLELVRIPDDVMLLHNGNQAYRWGSPQSIVGSSFKKYPVGLSTHDGKPYILGAGDYKTNDIDVIFNLFRDPDFRKKHNLERP